MKVLILTQTHQRDKDFDVLVAKELIRLGHEAKRTSVVMHGRRAICKWKPDVVVSPEARCEYVIDMAEQCQKMGVKFVVRRCEASNSRSEPTDPVMYKIGLGPWPYSHCVDLEFVWGPEILEVLVEQHYMPRDKLVLMGAPFVDLYKKAKNVRREELGLTWPDAKIILWAENWAYADRDPDYAVPEAPWGSPVHRKWHDQDADGRAKWLDTILKIKKRYPQHHFWFKIHPSTQTHDYHKALSKHEIRIIQRETSREILPQVDLLIHSCSTMSVEAHLLDIPAIRFGDSTRGALLSKLSPGYEDLPLDILDKIEWGKSNAKPAILKQLSKELYGPLDGKAYLRVAKGIHKKIKPYSKKNIPDIWPDSDKGYETEGVKRNLEWGKKQKDIIQCPGCMQMVYLDPPIMLCKCPYCALMLTRKMG